MHHTISISNFFFKEMSKLPWLSPEAAKTKVTCETRPTKHLQLNSQHGWTAWSLSHLSKGLKRFLSAYIMVCRSGHGQRVFSSGLRIINIITTMTQTCLKGNKEGKSLKEWRVSLLLICHTFFPMPTFILKSNEVLWIYKAHMKVTASLVCCSALEGYVMCY